VGVAPPTAPIAAGSLVGGYLVARETGVRPLGGIVLVGGGVYLTRRWAREAGPPLAGVLLATYLAGFGLSHPLAKRIGAWPSVLSVAAASAVASHLLADRRYSRVSITS
jgi:hypothetical protein